MAKIATHLVAPRRSAILRDPDLAQKLFDVSLTVQLAVAVGAIVVLEIGDVVQGQIAVPAMARQTAGDPPLGCLLLARDGHSHLWAIRRASVYLLSVLSITCRDCCCDFVLFMPFCWRWPS